MLYPKISNVKKSYHTIIVMLIVSVTISLLLLFINYETQKEIHWSLLAIAGIIYVWITTLYSIKRNINIASHVMVQMLCVSILLVAIDFILGYRGWSMKIGMPIVIIIANLSMVILALVSRKKYARYSLYQIIIFIVTIVMFCLIPFKITKLTIMYMVAASISLISLILSFSLCGKALINEIQKTFHL